VDQAISAKSDMPALHYLKAHVYGFEQNAQGAESELRRALELDPNYLAAYFDLAALFVNTKQQERAITEYQKIVERRPDDSATYTLIGMLEDSRQNTDAAIENYRKAVQLDPNAAIAANNLAWAYAVHGKGNLDEAVALAQGAVQRNPDVPGFADTLGWVYYKKGLHGPAVEQLQRVVAKAGDSASYRFHLGMALAGKGDKAAARRELEEALRLGEKQQNFANAEEARRTLATL
jgi:tetratricopeptide (TPR) repeat protein